MSVSKRCPMCQAEIPAGAPEGLCPQCLLQAGLAPKTDNAEPRTAVYTPSGSGFVPPTPEALQTAFPQLEILELLGKGGMGAVYKARQPGLDRLVAVKILPPEVSRDPAFAERFTREARALAKLNHPNIVGVFDSGRAGGYYYFVMEYLDGVNLRQAMRAGELKSAEALKIVPQICDALQFAHDEGIVHRDIKPENILLDKKGRVKIADFGLAKLLGTTAADVSLTGTQQAMGTMHYMAPEQFEGARDVDHRADIYSLGVTFYEMLTGELPIGRFAAPSKKVQIDVRLDEVVLRSLEKEPEQRYQHASEIKTDVETISLAPSSGRHAPPNTEAKSPNAAELKPINLLEATSGWKRWLPLVPLATGFIGFFTLMASNISSDRAPPAVCAGAAVCFALILLSLVQSLMLTSRWTVEYRGHHIAVEFQNVSASRRLMIDGLTVASGTGTALPPGGKIWDYELRAAIPRGQGIGDEIICTVERGMVLRCRIIALPKTPIAPSIEAREPEQRQARTASALSTGWVCGGSVVACFFIAAAGLVPIAHKNTPFWGLRGGSFDETSGVRIHEIDFDSPAQRAGLKVSDRVMAVNGRERINNTDLMNVLDHLKPGEPAGLSIIRPPSSGVTMNLTVTGEEPPIAMIYYETYWHPVAGGLAVVLALFLLATPTLAPRWRGLVIAIVGFGLAVGFFIVVTDRLYGVWPVWQVRRYHVLNWGEKLHFHQTWVGLAASLALTALGVMEMRSLAGRSPAQEPPVVGPAHRPI